MEKESSQGSSLFSAKAIGLIVVLLALAVLGWTRLSPYYRGLKPEPGQATEMDGPPSREQMRERGQEMMKQAGLSDEQQTQIREIMSDDKLSWEERRARMESITTPEQQQKFREGMRSRMTARMNAMKQKMGPDAQRQLDQRVEQRMRRGPRGGGPGGGGPGGGQRNR